MGPGPCYAAVQRLRVGNGPLSTVGKPDGDRAGRRGPGGTPRGRGTPSPHSPQAARPATHTLYGSRGSDVSVILKETLDLRERGRASGPCAATEARGARQTYMVRPARTQRCRPAAPQLPPRRRAARLAQGHVCLRSPGTSHGCRPGHCLKLGPSFRARRSLRVTSNS